MPTLRAAALLAAVGLVLVLVPGLGVVGGGAVVLILVAVVLDGAAAPAPWRVGVHRELPRLVALEGRDQLVWEVANPTGRTLVVAVADDLPPSLGAERRAQLRVSARGVGRATAVLRPRRRGTFRPREVTVRVAGPAGLAVRQAARTLPGEIQVHPRFASRQAAELRVRRARLLEQGDRSVRGRGAGGEFEALRDYVQGDESRHVDWAATARMGRPIVRTYRPERNQTVLVLLDTGRVMAGRVAGVPRLDHGMDAALALATVATRSGDRTGLVAFSSAVKAVVPPRRDAHQLRRFSTALHTLEPELVESAYHDAFVASLTRFRRRALLVVVTELAAEAVRETLVPALPLVLREHAVVVASLRDPLLSTWVEEGPQGPTAAYRAAAAAGLVDERRRTAAHLRSLGARVVDAGPDELPARLCDAYLDLKGRGTL